MRRYRHNLIRRAQADLGRFGVIALDTAALLNEAGIDIESTIEQFETLTKPQLGNIEVGF